MQQIKRLFQRQISVGRTFIPEIDGLRVIAIVSVVLFHLFGQTMRYYSVRLPALPALMLHNGDRGVRLFFIISGFILALPFARYHLQGGPAVSLRRYFLRRITRLEPPYIASLLLLAILISIDSHEQFSQLAVHLLATVGYCHNLIFGKMSTISLVAWSLEIEVQFYVLVPLLTSVFAIRRPALRRSILGGSVLFIGLMQTLFPGSARWQMSIGYYLQFFLAGFLLADLYLATRSGTKRWFWDAISFIGWPAAFLIPNEFVQTVLPPLAALLYWAAFHGNLVNSFFRHPAVVYTGGACYSIYLLHFPLIAAATRLAGHQRAWAMWGLFLALLTSFGATFFLLVEKPCMNPAWPRDLSRWFVSLRLPGTSGAVQARQSSR